MNREGNPPRFSSSPIPMNHMSPQRYNNVLGFARQIKPKIAMKLKFLFTTALLAFSKACNSVEFRTTPAEMPLSNNLMTVFEEVLAAQIKPHPGSNHPLFSTLTATASQEGLTPEQFSRLREGMFTRVFATVPSIFELGRQAALNGDFHTAATAILNLMEEGGEGVVARMHPKLMEEAFNTLGREVFGLPPVTMKECYENSRLPAALIYRATVETFYAKQGPLVSYAQEFASGGDNSSINPGMMGNIYNLFYRYRHNLPSGMFEKHILPYFSAHISVDDKTHEQIFKGDAIEFQHGERAKADALRGIETAEDIERSVPYILAFLEVQKNFFDAMLQHVNDAKNIGTPIPVRATLAKENVVPFKALSEGPHVAALRKQRTDVLQADTSLTGAYR